MTAETTPPTQPRRVRGKTTPAVRAGQAIAKALALLPTDRKALHAALIEGASASSVRASLKTNRKLWAETKKLREDAMDAQEETARLLDVAEGLDSEGRKALVGALAATVGETPIP